MTPEKLNPLAHQPMARTDWPRSDDHDWQGVRSDGTPIGPMNDQASIDDYMAREARKKEILEGRAARHTSREKEA